VTSTDESDSLQAIIPVPVPVLVQIMFDGNREHAHSMFFGSLGLGRGGASRPSGCEDESNSFRRQTICIYCKPYNQVSNTIHSSNTYKLELDTITALANCVRYALAVVDSDDMSFLKGERSSHT
jgi:hypothetical protein